MKARGPIDRATLPQKTPLTMSKASAARASIGSVNSLSVPVSGRMPRKMVARPRITARFQSPSATLAPALLTSGRPVTRGVTNQMAPMAAFVSQP